MAGFRCECWQEECTERIPLSGEQWAMVRTEPIDLLWRRVMWPKGSRR